MSAPEKPSPSPDLFAAVDGRDFKTAALDVDRYGARSPAFDRILAETHEHFWDPSDSRYIAFDTPFDLDQQTVLPMTFVPELQSAVGDRLNEWQKIAFANESARWLLSSVLHGEQGALSLSSSLCQLLHNPAAVEYAANQAREEARHVTAFSRYIAARWGKPFPVGTALGQLLGELVSADAVDKKIVGMQLLVEGLAMGIFSMLHRRTNDPVLRRLTQLVMVDEAFHHEAGKMWSRSCLPSMSESQRREIEDWSLSCFQVVVANLTHPREKQVLYDAFGLSWEWVRDALREAFANKERRSVVAEANKVFDVLIHTLFQAGIVTERTRHFYAVWTNLKEVDNEAAFAADGEVVQEGIAYLRDLNASATSNR